MKEMLMKIVSIQPKRIMKGLRLALVSRCISNSPQSRGEVIRLC